MRKSLAVVVSLALAVAGCGAPTSSLSGVVTLDGQPVEEGAITLFPASGKGQPASATIVKGRYTIVRCSPGEKVVQVIGSMETRHPRHSSELEEQFRKSQYAAAERPASVVANNEKVTLEPGFQTFDVMLKSAKPGR